MGAEGVQACKVDHITRAAGVGKGTFFTHFNSKRDFVAELAGQVLSDLARRVRPMGMAPTDAESLISGVSSVHLRYFQLRPQAASLLTEACALGSDAVAGHLKEYVEMVAGMVSPAGVKLGWPAERARELALMLLATACGFFWFGGPLELGADAPADLLDRLGRALARGLTAETH